VGGVAEEHGLDHGAELHPAAGNPPQEGRVKLGALVFSGMALLAVAKADSPPFDIVVYGGTSGGVVAAVQAARDGRRVALVSPVAHLGGMTISGLGWTDLGQSRILGGLSREFYHRAWLHYQSDSSWNWQTRASYGNAGQKSPAFDAKAEIASVFEPKVAESIFKDLLREKPVEIITGSIDLASGVKKTGKRITALHLTDGREVAGRMFIDATYEGDLLPGAGVTFTVGREANAAYGETVNGIQSTAALKNQLKYGISPYVDPQDPASGLLPGVEASHDEVDGTADHRLQAYCYRMVLTDVAANRVPIERPANYRESDYELLFRSISAGQTGGFFKLDRVPNGKTDSNNSGGLSTDFIGGNYGPGWDWTTLNYEQRRTLAEKHRDWQLGLIWTLQNSPRVPAATRAAYAKWGLAADEFPDNGHWPYDLYVREGRRMISDYVMTQRNCTAAIVASDSIGLAAYAMDSHHTRRKSYNGMLLNEGDIQLAVSSPYPVAYRSIIPRAAECENLLVPWSLSASHMAFGSIRMEPVFMTLSQSAAIAASVALEREERVQEIPYDELRKRLLAAGEEL
jgi:hypothetical protein